MTDLKDKQMKEGQSKLSSFWEANVNTVVGFILNIIFAPIVYSLIGMPFTILQLGESTAFFTVLSIGRGYVIRRWFNKKEKKKEHRMDIELRTLRSNLMRAVESAKHWKRAFFTQQEEALKLVHDYKVDLDSHSSALAGMNIHYNKAILSLVDRTAELGSCRERFQQYASDAAAAGFTGGVGEAVDVVWNNPKREEDADNSKSSSGFGQ